MKFSNIIFHFLASEENDEIMNNSVGQLIQEQIFNEIRMFNKENKNLISYEIQNFVIRLLIGIDFFSFFFFVGSDDHPIKSIFIVAEKNRGKTYSLEKLNNSHLISLEFCS